MWDMRNKKMRYSREEVLQKLYKYCTYQERCTNEVVKKMQYYGYDTDDKERIIEQLKRENYLNDERYASAYVRGKFRQRKWGIQKIMRGLRHRDIPDIIIQAALNEISFGEYDEMLLKLIKAKAGRVKDKDIFSKKNKIARFVIGKGYSTDKVWDLINEEIK
jgi:regulatory protein